MPALREATKKKIFDILNKSYFTGNNFSILYDDGQKSFLQILFAADGRFKYEISEHTQNSSTYYVSLEAPGQHVETGERYRYDSIASVIAAIGPWTERILEDYRSQNPILDDLDRFRKSLSEQLEEHVKDKDAHFSNEEAEDLKSKLDELATKLQEVLERTDATEQQLNEAMKEIEAIKNDVTIFPKGTWFHMAGNKILDLTKTVFSSPDGRKFIFESAKKFFLEDPK